MPQWPLVNFEFEILVFSDNLLHPVLCVTFAVFLF